MRRIWLGKGILSSVICRGIDLEDMLGNQIDMGGILCRWVCGGDSVTNTAMACMEMDDGEIWTFWITNEISTHLHTHTSILTCARADTQPCHFKNTKLTHKCMNGWKCLYAHPSIKCTYTQTHKKQQDENKYLQKSCWQTDSMWKNADFALNEQLSTLMYVHLLLSVSEHTKHSIQNGWYCYPTGLARTRKISGKRWVWYFALQSRKVVTTVWMLHF